VAFALRIPPARPTFPTDITDPGGWWGLAVVRTDEARAKEIAAGDPANAISPVEVFPMRMGFPAE
jgi:hypothetical protein